LNSYAEPSPCLVKVDRATSQVLKQLAARPLDQVGVAGRKHQECVRRHQEIDQRPENA
jgi:hypothetical protein